MSTEWTRWLCLQLLNVAVLDCPARIACGVSAFAATQAEALYMQHIRCAFHNLHHSKGKGKRKQPSLIDEHAQAKKEMSLSLQVCVMHTGQGGSERSFIIVCHVVIITGFSKKLAMDRMLWLDTLQCFIASVYLCQCCFFLL